MPYAVEPPTLDEEQRTVAAGPRWLLTGDAAVRVLTADAAGRPQAHAAMAPDWLEPYLGQLLADPYLAANLQPVPEAVLNANFNRLQPALDEMQAQMSTLKSDMDSGSSVTGDEFSDRLMMALFDELNEAGNTIVLVTHEEDIAAHARRTIRLLDGRVVSDGRRSSP